MSEKKQLVYKLVSDCRQNYSKKNPIKEFSITDTLPSEFDFKTFQCFATDIKYRKRIKAHTRLYDPITWDVIDYVGDQDIFAPQIGQVDLTRFFEAKYDPETHQITIKAKRPYDRLQFWFQRAPLTFRITVETDTDPQAHIETKKNQRRKEHRLQQQRLKQQQSFYRQIERK